MRIVDVKGCFTNGRSSDKAVIRIVGYKGSNHHKAVVRNGRNFMLLVVALGFIADFTKSHSSNIVAL